MKDLAQNFSKPGDLVQDKFKGVLTTGKGDPLLENHGKYLGCERNSCCLERSIAVLVEVYACQLLINKSDLEGGEIYKRCVLVPDRCEKPKVEAGTLELWVQCCLQFL